MPRYYLFLWATEDIIAIENICLIMNNNSVLRRIVKRSDKPEELLGTLKKMGITHMLIKDDIFKRWIKINFTTKDRKIMDAFFKKYVKLLFFKWGYGVFQLENFD